MPNLYDVDGYDVVTQALVALVNQFPGLSTDSISYATLSADRGKCLQPLDGAVVQSERKFIYGEREQTCLYPFYILYRIGRPDENRRAAVKEWLDNLGRWIAMQPIKINGTNYQLTAYPTLTGNRKFLSFDRQLQSPAFLYETHDNGTEDWAISISARYLYKYHV